ncbi:MAG: hypothetical protein U0002_07575 [Thermoanaerobaculia bacterium]
MLERTGAEVATERSSRSRPLTDTDAQALLDRAEKVLVARGKQIETFKAGEATLESLKGPTGGYRAPILLQGRTLLVGFNEEALRSLL